MDHPRLETFVLPVCCGKDLSVARELGREGKGREGKGREGGEGTGKVGGFKGEAAEARGREECGGDVGEVGGERNECEVYGSEVVLGARDS
ncbi:hypothetical protein RJT34_20311 [Clitoria ternatea]|uniref:Uncharacterized protein n=1 Tax=Clitoria ternatea TaxID=43366 RepID=A0AAN9ISM0_CLITE